MRSAIFALAGLVLAGSPAVGQPFDGRLKIIHETATLRVAYRADSRPFLVLVIDLARVRAPVRYEDPRRVYPHIYGPLNRDAIITVLDVPRAPDGTFLPPPEA